MGEGLYIILCSQLVHSRTYIPAPLSGNNPNALNVFLFAWGGEISFIGESSRRFPLSAETFRSGTEMNHVGDYTWYTYNILADSSKQCMSAVHTWLTFESMKGGYAVLLHESWMHHERVYSQHTLTIRNISMLSPHSGVQHSTRKSQVFPIITHTMLIIASCNMQRDIY